MGASDSKLVFKKGIFRLSEQRHIPADDPSWTCFWDLPESPEDIFSLFSPADIRRARDHALENLETLLLAVTSRLFRLRHHPAFPDADRAPEREALNCIRVLTRVLPFLYERQALQPWEERFFWTARRRRVRRPLGSGVDSDNDGGGGEVLFDGESQPLADATRDEFEDVKPLAEELIDTLLDLLFFADFTVARPRPVQDEKAPLTVSAADRVTYAIWQSGVGCNEAVPSTKEFESNRCEILRLLLTLTSPSMYTSPSDLPSQGIRALTYICTCPDKQVVLSVLCSLLNTTLKYNPASWRVPYNTLVFKDPKQILVTYSLQLLLVFLLYPVPETNGYAPRNFYRHFLGRLHRPADFDFLVDGLARILHQPLQANASYIPGTQSSVKCAPEILMLFWEITQCNKRFRAFIMDTLRVHDFVVLILFYALDAKNDHAKQGIVRMCAFVLQTLSVEKNFGIHLNKPFVAQESLPPLMRIQGFRGTYADFLIQSIYGLIATSQSRLTAIYPALLAVINNIAAYVDGLSARTCSRLMQLFSSMSSPSFLLANETNHSLLFSLLEALNATLEHKYNKNPLLVYTIVKNKRRFEALRNFTLESGREEIERRIQRRKDAGTLDESMDGAFSSVRSSVDSLRSPEALQHSHSHSHSHHQHTQPSSLRGVPEDETFAIGGDDDDDDDSEAEEDGGEPRPTPSQSSENPSRASSVISVEDAVPTQLRGMSEKARGKMPAGAPTFSRQNSTLSMGSASGLDGSGGVGGGGGSLGAHGLESHEAGLGMAGSAARLGGGSGYFEPTAQWIDSWLPELPLHTILTAIQQLSAVLPREVWASAAASSGSAGSTDGAATTTTMTASNASSAPSADTLRRIQQVELVGIEPSTIRVHSFEWSPLALGWYESLLWSFIFSSEMQVAKGTVGVWNSTAIQLFRVQETAPQGPSLTSPRGAVDAVGNNIVSRIGAMNLRGNAAGGVGGGGGGGGHGRNSSVSHSGNV